MSLNRLQLRNLVLGNCPAARIRADLVNTAFNMVMTEISQVYDFRSNRTEVPIALPAGQYQVTLPSTCWQLMNVRIVDATSSINSRVIELKDKTWVTQLSPSLSRTINSWPRWCFVENDGVTLVFVPPSTQDWTVMAEFYTLNALIADDTGTVNVSLQNAVIAWATAYVFRATQQYQDADKWMAEYGRALQLAVYSDRRTRRNDVAQGFRQFSGPAYAELPPWLNPFDKGDQ